VANLPVQISYEIRNIATKTRISQVKFAEGNTNIDLSFQLFLPKRADENILIGQPVAFYVLVFGPKEIEKYGSQNRVELTEDQLMNLTCGKVKLEVTPRGTGDLYLKIDKLYYDITASDKIKTDAVIKNNGTVPLYNIQTNLTMPPGWQCTIEPSNISQLTANEEQTISIEIIPPSDIGVGEMEIILKAEATANNYQINADDKILRIHISSKANVLGISILTILLIGVVVIIVIGGLKLSKR